MKYLNIIEKLKVLFDMLLDYKLSLVILLLLLIATILYTIKKINTKKFLLIILSLLIFLFGVYYISNYKVLSETFDNFWTIFFTNIYFPSIYVYIFTLFVIDISLIISFLNKTTSKVYRIINSFTFVISHVIFAIILKIISEQKIDIFEVTSLYSSVNLVAVLELSINMFIVWMLIIVTIYLTNTLSLRLTRKNKIVEEVTNLSTDNILQEDLSKEENKPLFENKSIIVNNFENAVSNEEESVLADSSLESNSALLEPSFVVKQDELIQDDTLKEEVTNDKKQLSFDDIISKVKLITPLEKNENIYTLNEEENVNLQDIISDISSQNDNVDVLVKNEKKESNSVSLNELLKGEFTTLDTFVNENKEEVNNSKIDVVNSETTKEKKYTAKDYKKAMEMLERVAPYHMNPNIKVSEAVAISLINNYSYDDCMMFKDILESCLAK